MKITCANQKNNSKKTQKHNVIFEAGLTPKMIQEIQNTDVLEISKRLAKINIPTDFKGNKIIAWCSYKTVQILQQLNRKFRQKLSLPQGIYVENFKNLKMKDPLALGTCNLSFSEFRKDSSERVPSRTVFFNSMYNWNNIDCFSNINYARKNFSTDFFLYPFLHEFSHVSHEDRLLRKFNGVKLAKMLESLNEEEELQKYRNVYGSRVRQICDYASNTPLDAIACDLPRTIVDALDKETLMPTRNPFLNTPYEKLNFWHRIPKYSDKDRPLKEILRNFWNGKFD